MHSKSARFRFRGILMFCFRRFLSYTALSCAALGSTLVGYSHASAQSFTTSSGTQVEQYAGPVREWIIGRAPQARVRRTPQARVSGFPLSRQQISAPRLSGLDSFEQIGGTTSYYFSSIGGRRLVVVLANILAVNKDGSTRFIPAPTYSAEQLKDFVFGPNNSVASQFRATSWGKTFLDGDITGDNKPDIIGPITLTYKSGQETDEKGPAPDYAGGDTTKLGDICTEPPILGDLIAEGILDESSPNDAMPLVLVDAGVRRYFNCPWYAATDPGSRGGQQTIISTLEPITASPGVKKTNRAAIVHEFGHAMGLNHSQGNSITYEGPNEILGELVKGYGDLSCNMGWGAHYGISQFNVPQSYRAGWLARRSTIEITRPGSYTVTLDDTAAGPYANGPTSVWIERRVFDTAQSPNWDTTQAPGFIVVSAGTGGAMIKRVKATQTTMTAPIERTVLESVPFGLTVHSVPLTAHPSPEAPRYLNRDTGGASFLEGMTTLNEEFTVPHLGVTVKLLARVGTKSIVQVTVKDLHQVVTENIERVAPGTLNALTTIVNLRFGGTLSRQELAALSTIANFVSDTYNVLEGSDAVSPKNYEAAKDTQDLVNSAARLSRQVLQGSFIPRLSMSRIAALKRDAATYLRYAKGESR